MIRKSPRAPWASIHARAESTEEKIPTSARVAILITAYIFRTSLFFLVPFGTSKVYHRSRFLSSVFLKKVFLFFFQKSVDISGAMCYYIVTGREIKVIGNSRRGYSERGSDTSPLKGAKKIPVAPVGGMPTISRPAGSRPIVKNPPYRPKLAHRPAICPADRAPAR